MMIPSDQNGHPWERQKPVNCALSAPPALAEYLLFVVSIWPGERVVRRTRTQPLFLLFGTFSTLIDVKQAV